MIERGAIIIIEKLTFIGSCNKLDFNGYTIL